ncbi:hypothetical protein SISSUDRAFT_967353, partial [Sistotremastrum suecicum HHB10207 ss-3]
LRRTAATGGGGRSLDKIVIDDFPGLSWDDLSTKEQKRVRLRQKLTRRWENDHTDMLVRSVTCKQVALGPEGETACICCLGLLGLKAFKNALARKPPDESRIKYTPKVHRLAGPLGDLFSSVKGLLKLVTDLIILGMQDPQKSPFLKFAQGVSDGQYDGDGDRVLLGMVDVMVRKKDRERRGKGMQNFKYERSFDEF